MNNFFERLDNSFKISGVNSTNKKSFRKKIVQIDPLTLLPIVANKSPKSRGHYKTFFPTLKKQPSTVIKKQQSTVKKQETKIKLPTLPNKFNSKLLKKPCPPGKVRNQVTGRCNKINKKKSEKICPEGKILKKGRCVMIPEDKKLADKARLQKLWEKHQKIILKKINEIQQDKQKRKDNKVMKSYT